MLNKMTLTLKNHRINFSVFILLGIVVLSSAVQWSCSSIIQPVSVKGEEADLALFAGEWKGEYYSKDLSRGGSIEFKLTSGEKTAFGEVVMIPRGSQMPFRPAPPTGEPKTSTQSLEILKISFVQISGGRVSGKIDPYWDPDNKVTLLTFFDGVLMDDTISGTFRSRSAESGYSFTGEWEVRRKTR